MAKMTNKSTKVITVSLPKALLKKLNELGIENKSQFISMAISYYLGFLEGNKIKKALEKLDINDVEDAKAKLDIASEKKDKKLLDEIIKAVANMDAKSKKEFAEYVLNMRKSERLGVGAFNYLNEEFQKYDTNSKPLLYYLHGGGSE